MVLRKSAGTWSPGDLWRREGCGLLAPWRGADVGWPGSCAKMTRGLCVPHESLMTKRCGFVDNGLSWCSWWRQSGSHVGDDAWVRPICDAIGGWLQRIGVGNFSNLFGLLDSSLLLYC